MTRLALAAAVAALACTARADDGDVRFHLALHGRFTDREHQPSSFVGYGRVARAFDVAPYLRPEGSDTYGSFLASIGASGRSGRFAWGFAADTGEVRETAFPRPVTVCASTLVPSGVDVAGGGRCDVVPVRRFTVDETRLGAGQVTANGRPFAEEARATLLVREAWGGAVFGRNDFARAAAGRRRFTVADGFVYDDYGTGVDVALDLGALGPSWDVGAAVFYPTRDFPGAAGVTSPMVAARADYLPSLFEHAGVFLALYRDSANGIAELFRGSSVEPEVLRLQVGVPGTLAYHDDGRALAAVLGSPLLSDGELAWLGTSGSLRAPALLRVAWTGAIVAGNVNVRRAAATPARSSDVLGELAWLTLRRDVAPGLEVGGFFLFLSGDLPPAERQRLGLPQRYRGFLGISPYVTATNIFFNGGVAETFAARQATAPGVNGRGVLSPGVTAAWGPSRTLGVDARAAWLVAPEVGPYGGRQYGLETDLVATWSPRAWLSFVAEADALFPGDFFPGRATITKVVLGLDLVGM